jgi:hypothetical protein
MFSANQKIAVIVFSMLIATHAWADEKSEPKKDEPRGPGQTMVEIKAAVGSVKPPAEKDAKDAKDAKDSKAAAPKDAAKDAPPRPQQPNTQTPSSKLYRIVDKDGRVTYTDTPPTPDQKSRNVETDKGRNLVRVLSDKDRQQSQLPANAATPSSVASTSAADRAKKREELDSAVRKAEDSLKQAKKTRDEGQDPQEGEQRIVVRQGGNSVIRTEGYYARIERLDANVKRAEEALEKALENYRRNAP